MADQKLAPVSPGEVLLEEFLTPMGLSQNRLALDIRVPARRINEIVQGKRPRYFDMSPQFWLGLQMDYDLDVAGDRLSERIECEVRVYSPT